MTPTFTPLRSGSPRCSLGRDVAEHRRAEPADHGCAYPRGDVIVARRDIGRQRPERVERRLAADFELLVHVLLYLVHRHMAGAFDHHLAVFRPGDLGQLSQCFQFGELRRIIRVGDRAGAQAIAERKGDVIGAADVADLLEMLVEKAFSMVMETPLRHDRTAARYDARHGSGSTGHCAR